MGKPVGIDLGTTNSLISTVLEGKVKVIPDPEGHTLQPSVVSFHPSGKILIGHKAKERKIIDPENTFYSTKRLIGRDYSDPEVQKAAKKYPYKIEEGEHGIPVAVTRGKKYTLVEIGAMILRYLKLIAEDYLKEEITQAVITVPANFNDVQRSSTKLCGELAGFEVLRIINEPTAAALAYGYGQRLNERIAIYDFGGGTFDITILEVQGNVFEVISTAGDPFLGGDDIDIRLSDKIITAFLKRHQYDLRENPVALQRVRNVAEQIKCQLSFRNEVSVRLKELAYGSGGEPLDLEFTITREIFESMIEDIVDQTLLVCDEAFRLANLTPTQIDHVLLVGGSSRIPLVRQKVREYFGKDPRVDINPDEVVSIGAAIQAYALTKVEKPKKLFPLPGSVRAEQGDFGDEGEEGEKLSDFLEEEETQHYPGLPEGDTSLSTKSPGIKIDGVPELPKELKALVEGRTLLLDVTPRALGIETVDGFYEVIIDRNVPLPVEQSRIFTTSQDNQTVVKIKIYQGESKRIEENTLLGEVELSGLRPAPRGEVKIRVKFEINTDGIVNVTAQDIHTGEEARTKVTIFGGLTEEEVKELLRKYGRR